MKPYLIHNPEATQRIKHLSERIKLFKESKYNPYFEPEILSAESEWHCSKLLADLIYHSELSITPPSLSDLKSFHENFYLSKSFSVDDLIEKFWVRIVMNRVEIPSAIQSAFREAEKLFPPEIELINHFSNFLITRRELPAVLPQGNLQNKSEKYFSSEDVKKLIHAFNNTHSENQINEDVLEKKYILTRESLNSDRYIFHQHASYYLFLHKNKVELKFINEFLKKYEAEEKYYYKIKKEKAKEIINQHRCIYLECPTIEDFLKQKFLNENEKYYLFKLSYGEDKYWNTLSNQIAGRLWSLIKSDKNFSSNDERLDVWLDKIFINHDYPSSCINFMNSDVADEFCALIEKRILGEQDLKDCSTEIKKVCLEESLHRQLPFIIDPFKIKFDNKQSNLEKFLLIKKLHSKNLLYEQECRKRVDLLIHILIRTGQATENPAHSFPVVLRLLNESSDRVHLLEEICMLIENQRPEIAPYLLTENGFEEIGIMLIQKFNPSSNVVAYNQREELNLELEKIKSDINKETLTTLLHTLSFTGLHDKDSIGISASIVARLLISLAKSIFFKPYNYDLQKKHLKDIQYNHYDECWKIISKFRVPIRWHGEYGIDQPLYFFFLLKDFLKVVIEYASTEPFNEFYSPELWRFDVLIRFHKIICDPVINPRAFMRTEVIEDLKIIEKETLRSVNDIYFNWFKIENIKVKRDSPLSEEDLKIKFQSDSFGIRRVDWLYYLRQLDEEMRQEFFQAANPNFDFKKIKNESDLHTEIESQNKLHRLRFHLNVVLSAYNSLSERFSSDDELKSEMEKNIQRIFCKYSQNILNENRADIFDKYYQRFNGENLFGNLIEQINYFNVETRRKILDSIANNTDALDRVLLTINKLTSDGDQKYLRNKITKDKLDLFLKDQYWLPDIELAMINAINNSLLTEFAEQIVNYIENNIKTRYTQEYEHQQRLFQVKLSLAYRKGDKNMLTSLAPPDNKNSMYSDSPTEDIQRKKYFETLFLYQEGKLEDALKEIDKLFTFRKNNPSIVATHFAFHIESAKQIYSNDKLKGKKKIKEALDIFIQLENNFKNENYYEGIRREALLNKLECYYLLESSIDFDVTLAQIKKVDQYTESFANLIIKNKIAREQWTEASKFIEELKIFHKHRSDKIPEFVEKLSIEISKQKEHINHLKIAYKNILTLPEEKRIKALPEVISDNTDSYGKFLLYELLLAATSLQQKLFAFIDKLEDFKNKDEDKITDILELIINARLSAWGLYWNSQTRTGKTINDTGELARADLSIKSGNIISVAEALRVYPYKNIETEKQYIIDHILKAFDETPSRRDFYHLIYYQSNSFETDWKKFMLLLSTLQFPERYKLIAGPIEIQKDTTSDLKAAFTNHETDVTCYYIFINLNYPVNKIAKTVSKRKKTSKNKKKTKK